ncbi:MAG: hypothetical protein A2Y17_01605 [Clostridiales bacterium GWF2_38_85]|nr:MAG: hypothetical protein A2Y17_01605 [Clostridiales bacterium GWF2_38_85]HBL84796.1 hypothetical protein [Clostridiales bacterium]
MFCKKCGTQMDDNAKFCPSCGAVNGAQSQQTYAPSQQTYAPPQPQMQYNMMNQYLSTPLSMGQYLGMMFLQLIPLVGFILLLMWAFGSNVNVNKKNYARAILIYGIIIGIITAIFSTFIITAVVEIFSEYARSGGYFY